jgi:hypothetical protein
MNERIRELAEQAGHRYYPSSNSGPLRVEYLTPELEKFAELIVLECMKESMAEIVSDENIEQESDPLLREYLKGNNQGIVDAVVRFRNHFGVRE